MHTKETINPLALCNSGHSGVIFLTEGKQTDYSLIIDEDST